MTETAQRAPGGDDFTRYIESVGDAPLLGYLVLYSILDGNVEPRTLAGWFTDLGLDPSFLPSPLRADGAYEIATSKIEVTYSLLDSTGPALVPITQAAPGTGQARPRRARATEGRTVTLMVRRVRRDPGLITCHLVREVRDAGANRLDYTDAVAEVIFHRAQSKGAEPGSGQLEIMTHRETIPAAEQGHLDEALGELHSLYTRHCRYLTGDKIRVLIRNYVESLHAVRVRSTGGVYFVQRHHHGTLGALQELARKFGAGSHLARVPLPDQGEMRVMVIEAFRTKARADLKKLAADIAEAQATANSGQGVSSRTVGALYERFRSLQAEAGEHRDLLSTDIEEDDAARTIVNQQLAALLAQAG